MSLLRRARGIEHEYILNTDPPLSLDENVERRRLIASAIEGLRQAGVLFPNVTWAVKGEDGNFEYENSIYKLWPFETKPPSVGKNGMRIYDDALHLEVSTPVYSTPEEALVYAKVSEYMALLGSQQAGASIGHPVYGYTSNISLQKTRKGVYEAVACGTHGNITVFRLAFNASKIKEARRALIPYLATRIIVTGSGGYVPFTLDEKGQKVTHFIGFGSAEALGAALIGDNICFVMSPRSHFINCKESVDTTVKRGFFNLRDEPHANRDLYWRFHDINWEGIRSDVQIYARDILQAFVIAAFEKGYLQDAPVLRDPLGALKRISMDMDLEWKVKLINGQTVDAVRDILVGYYLKRIEAMLDSEKSTSEDLTAFNFLSEFLNVVCDRDLSSLVYCLDWVTKSFLVEACDSPEEGLTACNQFCLVDQQILAQAGENVPPGEGDSLFEPDESVSVFFKWVPEVTSEGLRNAIKRGIRNPPMSTRETKRVQMLAKRSKANLEASWAFVADEDGAEQWFPEPLG